jgi:spore maturation protein CgeB
MSWWEKNLAVLGQTAPELAAVLERTTVPHDLQVEPSRQGPPTLAAGKVRLHSAYDPVKEGRKWARSQTWDSEKAVVVFGLGLGHHVMPVLSDHQAVFVVEPSPAVARLALEHCDLRPLLARNSLRINTQFRDLPRDARLLAYPPSRRLHPGLYRRLAAFLAGESQASAPWRILVVGPLHGGSLPIARASHRALAQLGHNSELLDFSGFHSGYQALGHILGDQPPGLRLRDDYLGLLTRILEAKVKAFSPDLVFCLAQAPVDPKLLERLKTMTPLLAFWFVEDFQVFPYWRDLAPRVDVFFTLQREPFSGELHKLGVRHHAFLPLAADPEVYRPLDLTAAERRRYGSALSFVGAGYANRREFFQGFLDYDFKIWGSEWDLNSPLGPVVQNGGVRVAEDEAARIFNATRINLNLHSSPFHRGINPAGDYVNPRLFDLAAAGAFQLVDRRRQLPEFFEPESEVATFASLAEAREKIDYYLAHGEERRAMAARARQRCLQEHTYTARLAEALEIVEDLHPGVLPRRPRQEAPLVELKRQFPPDHPVQEILARYPAEEIKDLGDLVTRLQEGEAPLSDPEAVLWLLHEFQQGLGRGRF